MSVKFANNAFGTLSAGISASGTSITLSSGQGARFPTLASGEYFYATLIDTSNNLEVVKVTARSTDVLTATRGQEGTTAQAFAIGDRIELRVTAAGLTDAANPYDKDTSSTGSFALPSGTTAEEPTAADTEGHIRYNTDDNVVYYSNGTEWLKVSSVIATLSSVTGNIYDGAASTLTLAGTGFQTANLVVNFTQSSDSIDEDVTVTPTSDTAATVAVPAAVYNNVTAGNVVSVTVTNSDGISSAAVNKTAVGLPSGGTVTTSGGYRIHTFLSSGNFIIPSNFSSSFEALLVGGGGGGGVSLTGGGGGGAVMVTNAMTISSGTKAVVVGGAGAGATGTQDSNTGSGGQGGSSTFNGITCTGGGGGASRNQTSPDNTGANGGGGSSDRLAGSIGNGAQGTAPSFPSGITGTVYGGYRGGNGGGTSPNYPGGGGAGASENGTTPSSASANGGDGGDGVQISGFGTTYYYGGGGGGASYSGSARAGNGGLGGGGGGADSGSSNPGIGGGSARNSGQNGDSSSSQDSNGPGGNGGANTGGGGGGGGHNAGPGGSGGTGIVVVRYQL